MTYTANHSIPEQGKFRCALGSAWAFLQAMDSTSFDYTHDRIDAPEREVRRLKEELRQSRDPAAGDAMVSGDMRPRSMIAPPLKPGKAIEETRLPFSSRENFASWEAAEEEFRDPCACIRFGDEAIARGYGVAAIVALHAPNVRSAIAALSRYKSLTCPNSWRSRQRRRSRRPLSLAPGGRAGSTPACRYDHGLAAPARPARHRRKGQADTARADAAPHRRGATASPLRLSAHTSSLVWVRMTLLRSGADCRSWSKRSISSPRACSRVRAACTMPFRS